MKRSFKIELFKRGELGICYAIKYAEQELNEAQRFEEKSKTEHDSYYRNIYNRLTLMLNRHLFKPPWLDLEEGRRDDRVIALKTPSDNPKKAIKDYGLRWYGLLCTENILILGNGGLKTTTTYQEDPELHTCVKDLQYVDQCLNERLNETISFDSRRFRIAGDLNFPVSKFKHINYPTA